MALISCPDCGAQVSDTAPACVACGRPIAAQVIEQTAKRWKQAQLVAFALVVVGFVEWTLGSGGGWAVVALVGMVLLVSARLGAWWENG